MSLKNVENVITLLIHVMNTCMMNASSNTGCSKITLFLSHNACMTIFRKGRLPANLSYKNCMTSAQAHQLIRETFQVHAKGGTVLRVTSATWWHQPQPMLSAEPIKAIVLSSPRRWILLLVAIALWWVHIHGTLPCDFWNLHGRRQYSAGDEWEHDYALTLQKMSAVFFTCPFILFMLINLPAQKNMLP